MTKNVVLLKVPIGLLSVTGCWLNILALVLVCKRPSRSMLTNLLQKNQCIFDGLSALATLAYQIFGSEFRTKSDYYNRLLCYIWSGDNLFWHVSLLSLYNVVCQSLDCMIAVSRPIIYRVHQVRLIVGFYVCLITVAVLLNTPKYLIRGYINSTCIEILPGSTTLTGKSMFNIYIYPWVLMHSFVPVVLCVIFIGITIYLLLKHNQYALYKELKAIIRLNVLLTAALFIFRFPDNIRILLALSRVLSYDLGSVEQQIGVLLTSISLCCNPCFIINNHIAYSRFTNWVSANVEYLRHHLNNHLGTRRSTSN